MALNFTTPDQHDVETVVLFTIDGIDYQVPAKPHAGIALRWMKDSRKNEEDATVAMLVALLGEENYDSLAAWPGLTMDIFSQIVTAAVALMSGAVEDPKDRKKGSTSKRG